MNFCIQNERNFVFEMKNFWRYANVEFRLYDMMPLDGSYTRVAPVSDLETPKILREEQKRMGGEGEDGEVSMEES